MGILLELRLAQWQSLLNYEKQPSDRASVNFLQAFKQPIWGVGLLLKRAAPISPLSSSAVAVNNHSGLLSE